LPFILWSGRSLTPFRNPEQVVAVCPLRVVSRLGAVLRFNVSFRLHVDRPRARRS
jgi:hypothetical protein